MNRIDKNCWVTVKGDLFRSSGFLEELFGIQKTIVQDNQDVMDMVAFGPGLSQATEGFLGTFILMINKSNKQIGFAVEGPSEVEIKCSELHKGIIKVSYIAWLSGTYEMYITADNLNICDSPHIITVRRKDYFYDYSNVYIRELTNEDMESFIIDAKLTNENSFPDILFFDDQGCPLLNFEVEELEKQIYKCHFKYKKTGNYIIFVSFSSIIIKEFPHLVHITTSFVEKDEDIEEKFFKILNEELKDAIEIFVQEILITIKLKEKVTNNRPDNAIFKWNDIKFGLILFGSSLNGVPIPWKTRYTIVIDMKNMYESGILGVSFEGPSDTNVNCSNDDCSKCIINYFPSVPGKYKLNVTIDGFPIEGSPFDIYVYDHSNCEQSKCHSPSEFSERILDNTVEKYSHWLHISEPHMPNSLSRIDSPILCYKHHSSNSSTESSPSILSGIYRAKIIKAKDQEKFMMSQMATNAQILESKTSSNCSSDMEVDLNYYEESLHNFYAHLISAFTTLIIIDILHVSIEYMTKIFSIETVVGISKVTSEIHSFSENLFQSHEVSTSLINSISLSNNLFINMSVENAEVDCSNFKTQLVDCKSLSTAEVKDMFNFCLDSVTFQSQCVENKSSFIENDYTVPQVSESNQTTLSVLECYKSFTIDLLSSITIPTKETIQNLSLKASAEVICDTLSCSPSNNISDQVSVYERPTFQSFLQSSIDISSEEMDLKSSNIMSINNGISAMSDGKNEHNTRINCFSKHSKTFKIKTNESHNRKFEREAKLKKHILRLKRFRISSFSDCSLYNICKKDSEGSLRIKEYSTMFINWKDEKIQYLKDIEYIDNRLLYNICNGHKFAENIATISCKNSFLNQCNNLYKLFNKKKVYHRNDISEMSNKFLLDILANNIFKLALKEIMKCYKSYKNSISLKLSDRETQTSICPNFFKDKLYKELVNNEQSSTTDIFHNNETVDNYGSFCKRDNYQNYFQKCYVKKQLYCSQNIKDISSAVETLVDAITDIAKNHVIRNPSKTNIARVEKFLSLLPKLLTFGKEKKLNQINFLTDELESILERNNNQTSNSKALHQIIKSIEKCIYMNDDDFHKTNSKLYNKDKIKDDNLEINSSKNEKAETSNIIEVRAVGSALEHGRINFDNKFIVYAKFVMDGSLSICFEGPSKADIHFIDKNIGIYVVCYRVDAPGQYICSILYNQISIPNSPFKIKVSLKCKKEKYNRFDIISNPNIEAPDLILPVDKNIVFHIHNPSLSSLRCFITGPCGISGNLPIEGDLNEGLIRLFTSNTGMYNLDFFNLLGERIGKSQTLKISKMSDEFQLNVIHCNLDLFPKLIDEISSTLPNILAYGEGLSSGNINSKNMFFLVISHECDIVLAKDPCLNITIDGPSKVALSCTDDSLGYTFWYIATVSGTYCISITYWNNRHIAGSPFRVNIRTS